MLKRGVRPIEYILVLVKQTLCQEQLQRKFFISSDVLKISQNGHKPRL